MEACFENNVEVIVLDRPNPLGGLKVDGPLLDGQWTSDVGRFRVPYVHGLTIGELARMAKEAIPRRHDTPIRRRARPRQTHRHPDARLARAMRWPDTGLRWVPTSPMIPDFNAVMGYPMTGLGCYIGGFTHGVGDQYPFRGLAHKTVHSAVIERELQALHLPGLRFQRVSVPGKNGPADTGIFVEVVDWDQWRPTELNFYLMKLACKLEPKNPFVAASDAQRRTFLVHVGSPALLDALKRDGAKIDVDAFIRDWEAKAKVYQQESQKFWLYN
jgi:uncharacterized protein YbbC (DUF1343 family)